MMFDRRARLGSSPLDGRRDSSMTTTISSGPPEPLGAMLDEVGAVLSRPTTVAAFSRRGLNANVASLAVTALTDYLRGDVTKAAEGFRLIAEEVAAAPSQTPGDTP
jgi:hypothetical protein